MIDLYVYPSLYGLPSNNPFDLKVDTYFRLAKIDYKLHNTLDAQSAPRKQLPYIEHEQQIIGDSINIISYIDAKYGIGFDKHLTEKDRALSYALTSMLDNHLYFVISYSRWQDQKYFPQFRDEFIKNFPSFTKQDFAKISKMNSKKYHHQGIGRYTSTEVYRSGISDIKTISQLIAEKDYLFSSEITIADISSYAYLANIFYFDIDTPLKNYILSDNTLVAYLDRIRSVLGY